MNLLRQRQLSAAPRGDEVEFDAAVMLLFRGAKARVGHVGSNPRAIGARAAGEHDGHGVNQAVVSRRDLPRRIAKQLFDQEFTGRGELIQAVVEALICGQSRERLFLWAVVYSISRFSLSKAASIALFTTGRFPNLFFVPASTFLKRDLAGQMPS